MVEHSAVPTAQRGLRDRVARRVGAAETPTEVLGAAASVLMPALGSGFAALSTVDPADLLGTSCHLFDAAQHSVPIGEAELARERRLFELEWIDTDPNTFGALRRQGRIAAALRADVADPNTVTRFRELLAPLGARDELRVRLVHGDETWGTMILYELDGAFPAGAAATAARCAPVIGAALRRTLLAVAADATGVDGPPGTVVLDADDQPVVSSPAAEELLWSLDPAHARTALVAVAAQARVTGIATSTVVGTNGVIGLHAGPAKGLDGGVAVVVERPRPAALAPLILRAFGFTDRERQVAEGVLQGLTRRTIARQLGIGVDTVDDHLERIYRKAGVPSRAALCAVVFDRFYRPHRHCAPPGPYGWFLLDDADED